MVSLGIDTSGKTLGVGICENQEILGERLYEGEAPHSVQLIREIGALFDETGVTLEDVTLVAVTGGPGRYTALRVGMATAKGITMARDIPLVRISTLQVMASSNLPFEGCICTILDARRQLVYFARFNGGGDTLVSSVSDQALSYEKAASLCPNGALLTGDGVSLIQPWLKEQKKRCLIRLGIIRGGEVARLGELAFAEGARNDIEEGPIYIRKVEIHNPNVERR